LLTFVVAGGGFSGVEVMAEVNDFVRAVNRRSLRHEPIHCVLVHSGNRILPEMTEGLALFAQKILTKRGVEFRFNDRLVAATSEKAILKSGAEIPTKTVVSTVPSALAPVLQHLECPKKKGRLLVNAKLELEGLEGQVWALGDCAFITTKSGDAAPPTAQHATREAVIVAENIAANIRGGTSSVFDFGGLGKLGSLGHFSAVAEILGIRVSGFLAWFLWRSIYLLKMPGLNRKLRIALDWTIALIFPPDLVQLRVVRESGIFRQHFEPGEVVFNQGDLGDSVYVIEKGECEVWREKDGKQSHLATLVAGDYFGEMAVLADVSRNATIRARTALDVVLIRKNDFNLLKTSVPAFGDVFRELARARAAANAQGPGVEPADK
jgi:NADH dehydrogenase